MPETNGVATWGLAANPKSETLVSAAQRDERGGERRGDRAVDPRHAVDRLAHRAAAIEREDDLAVALGLELLGVELAVARRGLPVDVAAVDAGLVLGQRLEFGPLAAQLARDQARLGVAQVGLEGRRAQRGDVGQHAHPCLLAALDWHAPSPSGPVQRSQSRSIAPVPRRSGVRVKAAAHASSPRSSARRRAPSRRQPRVGGERGLGGCARCCRSRARMAMVPSAPTSISAGAVSVDRFHPPGRRARRQPPARPAPGTARAPRIHSRRDRRREQQRERRRQREQPARRARWGRSAPSNPPGRRACSPRRLGPRRPAGDQRPRSPCPRSRRRATAARGGAAPRAPAP